MLSFGADIVEFLLTDGVRAVRFPDKSIKGKLHMVESVLKNFRDNGGWQGGENRGGVNVLD